MDTGMLFTDYEHNVIAIILHWEGSQTILQVMNRLKIGLFKNNAVIANKCIYKK